MAGFYVCTSISKDITEDNYVHGCAAERSCVMSEATNIKGTELVDLIAKLNEMYAIEIDDLWLPTDCNDGGDDAHLPYVGWNRMENADGAAASNRELDQWRVGELKLWLAGYTFTIEYHTSRDVTIREFKMSGLKTHE